MMAKTIIFTNNPDLPLCDLEGFLPGGSFEKGARIRHAGHTYTVVSSGIEIDDEVILWVKVQQVDVKALLDIF